MRLGERRLAREVDVPPGLPCGRVVASAAVVTVVSSSGLASRRAGAVGLDATLLSLIGS